MIPAHTVVEAEGKGASKTLLMLHGIMGSSKNWRSFARRLVELLPAWRAVLVDLRNHGSSYGAKPPHTLEACAGDLARLAGELGAPEAVCGHSFGGKVALMYAREHAVGLRRLFVLDCPALAAAPEEVVQSEVGRLIGAIQTIPMPVARRAGVSDELRARGFSKPLAGWMATNLEKDENGHYVWRFDVDALDFMIRDYWAADLLGVLESPPHGVIVDVVRAGLSDRWTDEELRRMSRLREDGPTRVHVLPRAGHWLHVDDPDGLLEIIGRGLRAVDGDAGARAVPPTQLPR